MQQIIKNPIINCTKDSRGIYKHFNIHEKSVSLYGKKKEDIIQVKVDIHEDQEPNILGNSPDYWAWVENDGTISSLIWAQYFLLNMCFPYGMKVEEEAGKGKAYRVTITEI